MPDSSYAASTLMLRIRIGACRRRGGVAVRGGGVLVSWNFLRDHGKDILCYR